MSFPVCFKLVAERILGVLKNIFEDEDEDEDEDEGGLEREG